MRSACRPEEGVSSVASIMTNASALTALQSLNATNKALEMTQARISTGYRVATASDNAAYWSIATTMRSDKSSLSVVQDALGLGACKVDTAYSAHEQGDRHGQRDQGQARRRDRRQRRRQGQDPDRNRRAAGAAEDAAPIGATFSGSNWLSVESPTHRQPPSAGVHADRQDRLVLHPQTRPARSSLCNDRHHRPERQALRRLRGHHRRDKGILDGLRLGTTGVRDDTATAARRRHGRRDSTATRSRR